MISSVRELVLVTILTKGLEDSLLESVGNKLIEGLVKKEN